MRTPISLRLDPPTMAELDAVAKKMGWTRTGCIKSLFLGPLRLMAQAFSVAEARKK